MADRSSTCLTIGGTIPTRDALDDLLDCISSDGWCVDWDGDPEGGWEAHLLALADQGKPLHLSMHESAGGGYGSDVIAWATEHGLHWIWQWDGCSGAYEGGMNARKPGIDQFADVSFAGNTDSQQPSISLGMIREWQAAGTLDENLKALAEVFGEPAPLAIPTEARQVPAATAV